jgi:hypothetical protein
MTAPKLARAAAVAALLSACAAATRAQQPAPAAPSPPAATIGARTQGMTKRDGFLPLYLDRSGGRVLLELPRDSVRALMFTSLSTGLGSNPIGLDRGAGGDNYVARFDRYGDRVLVVFENWNYRSSAPMSPA